MFVVGSGVDVSSVKAHLRHLVSLPVSAPDEPELALARGAALARANAPAFEATTVGLAYSQDPDGTTAGNAYAGLAAAETQLAPVGCRFTASTATRRGPIWIRIAAEEGRKPFLLVGSALTSIFVVGVVALVISLAVSIRPTVDQRPNPGSNAIVPALSRPRLAPRAGGAAARRAAAATAGDHQAAGARRPTGSPCPQQAPRRCSSSRRPSRRHQHPHRPRHRPARACLRLLRCPSHPRRSFPAPPVYNPPVYNPYLPPPAYYPRPRQWTPQIPPWQTNQSRNNRRSRTRRQPAAVAVRRRLRTRSRRTTGSGEDPGSGGSVDGSNGYHGSGGGGGPAARPSCFLIFCSGGPDATTRNLPLVWRLVSLSR